MSKDLKEILIKDEKILITAKLDKWLYLPGIMIFGFITVIAIILLLLKASVIDDASSEQSFEIVFPNILFFIVSLIPTLYFYCLSKTQMVITNERIIKKTILLSEIVLEMLLEDLDNIYVERTRLVEYGNIIFQGKDGNKLLFKNIYNPNRFKKEVDDILNSRKNKEINCKTKDSISIHVMCSKCEKMYDVDEVCCPYCGQKAKLNNPNKGKNQIIGLFLLLFTLIIGYCSDKQNNSVNTPVDKTQKTSDNGNTYPDSVYPKAVIQKMDKAIAEAETFRKQAVLACTKITGSSKACDCITKVWAIDRPKLSFEYYEALIYGNHEKTGIMTAQQGTKFMNKVMNCNKL